MLSPKLAPEIRSILEAMAALGGPPLETLPPAEARAASAGMAAFAGEPEPVASVEDRQIPGPGGPLTIRLYKPEGTAPFPWLLFLHGGGWVVCNLDSHDNICRAIARRSGAMVVAVDYRLSPEVKFPAALDDCRAALDWLVANSASLGLDPRRLAIGGDSAGANMATVIASDCRNGGPAIALQVLVYPVTNLASSDTPSNREFAADHFLTRGAMDWFAAQYLSRPEDARNPRCSPEFLTDLKGMPPTLLLTAECDPLRDEGEAYAERLKSASVAVTCTRYDGMIHPFLSMLGATPSASKAIDQMAAAIRAL